MNEELFYLGLLEFGLSFGVVLVMLYITFKILNRFLLQKHNVAYKNMAFGVVCSGIFISVAYLISSVKEVMIETIRALQQVPGLEDVLFWEASKYFGLFLFMSIVVIAITNVASIGLFTIMTKGINEIEEIKNNNIAVGIITATLMICISMMCKASLVTMMQSFIPYPSLPNIGF